MSDAPSRGVLATASETAKLPITFSADSLELMAGEDHTDGNESTNLFIGNCGTADVNNLVDADDSEAENEDCHSVHYDFADIDAVLNHIPTGSGIGIAGAIDVDVASQVSDDSLEDAVWCLNFLIITVRDLKRPLQRKMLPPGECTWHNTAAVFSVYSLNAARIQIVISGSTPKSVYLIHQTSI